MPSSDPPGAFTAALLVALVVAIPASGRSGPTGKPKPIGELIQILQDDVYLAGKFVTHKQPLYAGRAVQTAARGRVRFKLRLKETLCTQQKRTRIIVHPRPGVALRVTSAQGEIWCGTARAKGLLTVEGPGPKGKRTIIATKDPVFGLVVAKNKVVVKVRRGAVVVAGRSGRKRAVIVGGAREAVIPQGGDPRQPQAIALGVAAQGVSASLADAVPSPSDKTPPVAKLLGVPGDPSDEVLARFSFTTTGNENRTDITYACSFDRGGFFVCSPPVRKAVGPGRHVFAVRAVDAAGNFGKIVSREWTVERPPSGWIAFESNRDGNYELYAMNPDGQEEAARLTENSAVDVDPAWSPDGRRLVFESDRDGGRSSDIYTMSVGGSNLERLTEHPANDRNPKWSRSGRQIAFESNRDGDYEIYVMTSDGKRATRLTTNTVRDSDPAWSPDATKIAFESDRDGNPELYVMNADGSGVTRLTTSSSGEFNPVWSPDGRKIAFDSDSGGNQDIHVMNADGSAVVRLTTDAARDADPAWSPDGKRIAFGSNRHRNTEIYVMNADGGAARRLTRSDGENLVPNW